MKSFAPILMLCLVSCMTRGQEVVYFLSGDSLKIRSDLYLHDYNQPFIILCHEAGSNRDDYYDIAPRLLNLNYNCLAVDLRSGGPAGLTGNETAGLQAAILYVKRFNEKPVILFGGSALASLCILTSLNNQRVQAVVAFSPGEFFQPRINMADEMKKIDKPLFISGSKPEFAYLEKMTGGISPQFLTLFKPRNGDGAQGIRALKDEGPAREEYWFGLMMFFKKLK